MNFCSCHDLRPFKLQMASKMHFLPSFPFSCTVPNFKKEILEFYNLSYRNNSILIFKANDLKKKSINFQLTPCQK